jgi:hypothetical protein
MERNIVRYRGFFLSCLMLAGCSGTQPRAPLEPVAPLANALQLPPEGRMPMSRWRSIGSGPQPGTREPAMSSNRRSGALTEFDAPRAGKKNPQACEGYCGTIPYGINDAGVIVGAYTDKHIVPYGFLRDPSGKIHSFEAPGAGLGPGLNEGTAATAINDKGVITGQYQDSQKVYHGFVRGANGHFVTFDAPGAGSGQNQGTIPLCINISGETAGVYYDGTNHTRVFVRSRNGKTTSVDEPDSIFTALNSRSCLNAKGELTGYFEDSNSVVHGFLREPNGKLTTFDGPNSIGTSGAGINDEGVIAGYFAVANSVYYGLVRNRDGRIITLDDPNGGNGQDEGTGGTTINSNRTVAGNFNNAKGFHGMSYSHGKFVTIDAPGAGTGPTQGTYPNANNSSGTVTGNWLDANNLNHGFVWTP